MSQAGSGRPQERTTFHRGALSLSAIVHRPHAKPRAIVLALHGGGYGASYWHHPDHSLLARAEKRGMVGIAIDRPGYGAAGQTNMSLTEQMDVLFDLFAALVAHHDGVPLLAAGHSMGAILALMMAASPRAPLISAVDASGVPFLYPDAVRDALAAREPAPAQTHFLPLERTHVRAAFYGPDGSFAPEVLVYDAGCAAPIPTAEIPDAAGAPETLPALLPEIACPVRLSFAEHEKSSVVDDDVIARARSGLAANPASRVRVEAGAGHNISLHNGGGRFHDAMLDWFETSVAMSNR